MTKPRFTPDPLPDGLDPTLRAYLQRQFDRAADWWPKDLEARVAGLERTFKYISGVWPIVDYSTVEFNGSAVVVDGACSPTTATFQQETNLVISPLTSVGFNSIEFDSSFTRLYAAQSSGTGNGQGITQYALGTAGDISTISYVAFNDLGTTPGELFTGVPGNINLDRNNGVKFIVSQGLYSSGRWLRTYEMGTPWDITTATRTKSFDISGQAPFSSYDILSMVVSEDGKHIFATANYTGGSQWRGIYQWSMSTPWDVSTATYIGASNATDIAGDDSGHIIRIYYIDPTGKYILTSSGYQNNILAKHSLSSAYDITSRSYEGVLFLSALGQLPDGKGLVVPSECGALYALDTESGAFNLQEYELT